MIRIVSTTTAFRTSWSQSNSILWKGSHGLTMQGQYYYSLRIHQGIVTPVENDGGGRVARTFARHSWCVDFFLLL